MQLKRSVEAKPRMHFHFFFSNLSLTSVPLSCTDLHSTGSARLRELRRCHLCLIDHRSVSALSFVTVLPPAAPHGHSPYLPSLRVPSCSAWILILPAHAHSLRGLRGARRTFQRSGSIKCAHCAAWLDFTQAVRVPLQLTGQED